jgi:hypothetical protein
MCMVADFVAVMGIAISEAIVSLSYVNTSATQIAEIGSRCSGEARA